MGFTSPQRSHMLTTEYAQEYHPHDVGAFLRTAKRQQHLASDLTRKAGKVQNTSELMKKDAALASHKTSVRRTVSARPAGLSSDTREDKCTGRHRTPPPLAIARAARPATVHAPFGTDGGDEVFTPDSQADEYAPLAIEEGRRVEHVASWEDAGHVAAQRVIDQGRVLPRPGVYGGYDRGVSAAAKGRGAHQRSLEPRSGDRHHVSHVANKEHEAWDLQNYNAGLPTHGADNRVQSRSLLHSPHAKHHRQQASPSSQGGAFQRSHTWSSAATPNRLTQGDVVEEPGGFHGYQLRSPRPGSASPHEFEPVREHGSIYYQDAGMSSSRQDNRVQRKGLLPSSLNDSSAAPSRSASGDRVSKYGGTAQNFRPAYRQSPGHRDSDEVSLHSTESSSLFHDGVSTHEAWAEDARQRVPSAAVEAARQRSAGRQTLAERARLTEIGTHAGDTLAASTDNMHNTLRPGFPSYHEVEEGLDELVAELDELSLPQPGIDLAYTDSGHLLKATSRLNREIRGLRNVLRGSPDRGTRTLSPPSRPPHVGGPSGVQSYKSQDHSSSLQVAGWRLRDSPLLVGGRPADTGDDYYESTLQRLDEQVRVLNEALSKLPTL